MCALLFCNNVYFILFPFQEREEGEISSILPKDRINQLVIHKYLWTDGMHLRLLMELADIIARLLSNLFKRSWILEEVLNDWEKKTKENKKQTQVSVLSWKMARGRFRGLWAGLPHLSDWIGDRINPFRNNFQSHEGQKGI